MLIAAALLIFAVPVSPPCDTPDMAQEETQWKRVEHQDGVTVYTPPEGSARSMRLEYLLPSRATIVDDRDVGLAARVEMREAVDWPTFTPRGDELREDDVQRRAAAGDCFVIFRYQDCVNASGEVVRSVLRSIEEYAGRNVVRHEEVEKEVSPPQHLTGVSFVVPEKE